VVRLVPMAASSVDLPASFDRHLRAGRRRCSRVRSRQALDIEHVDGLPGCHTGHPIGLASAVSLGSRSPST
jgi:hypothetical protein